MHEATGDTVNHSTRAGLAARLRELREDMYGEFGSQFLADALEIPVQTWLNYESGVVAPAHVVLQLLVLARVNADWLLTWIGEKYVWRSKGQDQTRAVSGCP